MHKSNGRKCHVCRKWNTKKRVQCQHCGTALIVKVTVEVSEDRKQKKPTRKNPGKGFGNDGHVRRN